MNHRLAVICGGMDDLIEKLNRYARGETTIDGVFTGSAKAGKATAELLAGGREGAVFLETVIQDRNLPKLARLWTSGAPINWRRLHADGAPSIVSLPTYPFARERCRMPEPARGASRELSTPAPHASHPAIHSSSHPFLHPFLHPLIQRNTSTLLEQRFSTTLTGAEFFMADHVVAGKKMLPGAAYIEMARAAGEIAGAGPIRTIKNIIWAQPIRVENEPRTVYIRLVPGEGEGARGSGGVAYEVSLAGEDPGEEMCSRGILVPDAPPAPMDPMDLAAVKKRCVRTMSGDACYALFREMGLSYGPGFRPIEALRFNETEALARLKLPGPLAADKGRFLLHPSLVDGAFQTVVGLVSNTAPDDLLLPFALGEAAIAASLPERCYAHVASVGAGKAHVFDVHLLDPSGRVVARMKDFTARAISRAAAAETPEILCFKERWETAAPGGERPASTIETIVVFDSDEALARACGRLLPGIPVIRVKSGPRYRERGADLYEIDPGSAGDYRRLVDALFGERVAPAHILYNGETFIDPSENFASLLRLGRSLMEGRPGETITLLYLHPGIPENAPPGSAPDPFHGAVSGFANTIRLENPRLHCKTVRLENPSNPGAAVENVLREPRFGDGAVEVRYDGAERFVKTVAPFDMAAEALPASPLEENGAYLITGGLGGPP